MAERKTPELRFEGFDGDWEEKKFSELYKKVTEKNDYSFDTEKIISVANMFYNPDNTVTDKEYLLTYNIMRLGDIAFEGHANKDYAHGRFVENYIGDGIVSHIFDVFRPIVKQDVNFWRYCINNEKVMQKPLQRSTKSATMMNNLVSEDFLLESIKIPNEKEQQQIGSFFKSLDQQILLTQEKLEKTKTLKKTMLQKMFPQEGSKVPEIRLEGFSGDWEKRKLSSVAKRITRKNVNNESDLPLTISAVYGLVDQRDFFTKQIAGKDVSGYFLVKKGEYAYNKSYSAEYPWGTVKKLEKYECGVVSTLYIVFSISNIEPQFFSTYFDTSCWFKEIENIAAEGARNHGLLNIAPEDFFKINIFVPVLEQEQKALGNFFDNLSEMITTQTQKLELLKTLKKSLLEKMFV